jgi:pyruvate dehydrogenase E1 component alpha subunit
MRVIRRVEETIGDLVVAGEVGCPCHLAIGQEACAVGVATALRPIDGAFGAHRSHGHYLAMGGSVESLFAEVLGLETGCSRGLGGSMHLSARSVGLLGTVPIVGATIPMAVGAGLSAKLRKSGGIGVAYFGDGATEEGGFHESMNLAAAQRIPVLFVCEHNLFSSHLHIGQRQPAESVSRYAVAHRVISWTLDGNDVVAVARTTREAVNAIRTTGRPAFLELVTYRWRGHVGPNEDTDVGVQRADDLPRWRRRDPVARLEAALINSGRVRREQLDALIGDVQQSVKESLARARVGASPGPDRLTRSLYVRGAV